MPPNDAFDDAEELEPSSAQSSDEDLAALFESLVRAELTGSRRGAVEGTILGAPESDRARLALCLADAMQRGDLATWIQSDPARSRQAIAIACACMLPDPGAAHNARVMPRIRDFRDWDRFEHRVLVVPGYTPLDTRVATPGVHPVTRRRLEMAAEDLRANKAPFLLLSGGNVYPRGTPFYEAIEMKSAVRSMGIDDDRILVEARARHTTTNLRNAGRMMRALGIPRAVLVTKGGGIGGSDFFGQDFYLANPTLSTFHSRCERELGYRVGELEGIGDGRILFTPSPDVDRLSFRDPLDP